MASDDLVAFEQDTAAEIVRAKNRVLGSFYNQNPALATPPGITLGDTVWVLPSSTTASANGWYPASFQAYSAAGQVWSAPAFCWAFDANGGAIASTTNKLLGKIVDAEPGSGLPVIAVALSTGSGGGADVVQKDWSFYRQVGTSPFECWYPGGINPIGSSIATNNTALVSAQILAAPFVESRGGTLDRIAFKNGSTTVGGLARVGIYNTTSATNLYPASLIVDGGQQDCSVGVNTVKSTNITTVLTANTLYWLVMLGNNTLNLATIAVATGSPGFPFGINNTFAAPNNGLLVVAQAYGALPNTFPAGASVVTLATSVYPVVAVRYSA